MPDTLNSLYGYIQPLNKISASYIQILYRALMGYDVGGVTVNSLSSNIIQTPNILATLGIINNIQSQSILNSGAVNTQFLLSPLIQTEKQIIFDTSLQDGSNGLTQYSKMEYVPHQENAVDITPMRYEFSITGIYSSAWDESLTIPLTFLTLIRDRFTLNNFKMIIDQETYIYSDWSDFYIDQKDKHVLSQSTSSYTADGKTETYRNLSTTSHNLYSYGMTANNTISMLYLDSDSGTPAITIQIDPTWKQYINDSGRPNADTTEVPKIYYVKFSVLMLYREYVKISE